MLKVSIRARIDDYDVFFKKNYHDHRISFFEKQKFRLRKLLSEDNTYNRSRINEVHAGKELKIVFKKDNVENIEKHIKMRKDRSITKKTAKRSISNASRKSRNKSTGKEEEAKVFIKLKMTKEEHNSYVKKLKQTKSKEKASNFSKNSGLKGAKKRVPPKARRGF